MKKRALLLHGPSGIGKTSLVYVAGLETKAEIFELNASDLRNKGKLQEILKPAMEQRSLGLKDHNKDTVKPASKGSNPSASSAVNGILLSSFKGFECACLIALFRNTRCSEEYSCRGLLYRMLQGLAALIR